ncbi:hypothetical protein O1611_g3608 [Lasiodiplodia mahajangana]|uniref:Uncharacterized protein n=1 Tax=Lasiodiplodia mahajangana TaxID=1108764 RepID=A0ACC2JRA7_9PEZI|nr:hypothetical protein O1611_g3608 [Lasiodiplodia mahajangana]
MWLRDLLPEKLPGCRVMTLGYDASAKNISVASFRDTAHSLLQLLRDMREDPIYANIPIVFVGHSLGGIIIKQAILLARNQDNLAYVAKCIKGVVFFGTPHLGLNTAQWNLLVMRIVNIGATVASGFKRSLLKNLQTQHLEGLLHINEDFQALAAKYAIVSFYEEHSYRVWDKVILDKEYAVTGLPHEERMMISGTHTSMCRFSKGDVQFEAVWKRIKKAAEGVKQFDP